MIYFVRHGESQANVDKVFSGPNTKLTQKGRLQAKTIGKQIKTDGIIFDQIICSSYDRAVKTAKIISHEIDFNENNIQYDNRLIELGTGDLTNKLEASVTLEQILATKNIEPLENFHKRVMIALKTIKLMPGNTLIVSHTGVGCMLQVIIQNLDINNFHQIKTIQNCQLIKFNRL